MHINSTTSKQMSGTSVISLVRKRISRMGEHISGTRRLDAMDKIVQHLDRMEVTKRATMQVDFTTVTIKMNRDRITTSTMTSMMLEAT